MFRRLHDGGTHVRILIDGRSVEARGGETVAAAMLAAGFARTRVTAAKGEPRGPYCAVGACHDCLVTIDGIGNRRACMEPVADGMSVETQGPRRELGR